MNDQPRTTVEWDEWKKTAREREPIFLDAIDHHEIVKNYPGVEIIRITEPSNGR